MSRRWKKRKVIPLGRVSPRGENESASETKGMGGMRKEKEKRKNSSMVSDRNYFGDGGKANNKEKHSSDLL
jgi:hypothetical protein